MVYNGIITWFHRQDFGTQPCQVKILGEVIRVDCLANTTFDTATWEGFEAGLGHYLLHCEDGGEATLHKVPSKLSLEGHCNENYSGGNWMWQIDLTEPIVKESKIVGKKK